MLFFFESHAALMTAHMMTARIAVLESVVLVERNDIPRVVKV